MGFIRLTEFRDSRVCLLRAEQILLVHDRLEFRCVVLSDDDHRVEVVESLEEIEQLLRLSNIPVSFGPRIWAESVVKVRDV